eukprot:CAMPEP_0185188590 /NCGR_PEP_ID=MMETSP1140-20130426/5509_1 /TAXON_ID=298111 /ORGANISM="Pavlova sp., Strain CCMP459" /LENGTH=43 /DNA_ID= /DNA_START= /DNA_END= /DNA_ORIENTATION=
MRNVTASAPVMLPLLCAGLCRASALCLVSPLQEGNHRYGIAGL